MGGWDRCVRRTAAAFACAALLATCAGQGRIVVLADSAWWESTGFEVLPDLRRAARQQGLAVEVMRPAAEVPEELLQRPPALVFAPPPAAAAELAAAVPAALIVGTWTGPAANRPPNLLALRYEPEEAFEEAGRLAAASGCTVGLLAPAGSTTAAAFRAGFGAEDAMLRLRERAIAAEAGRAELRRAIDDLHAEGVRLFVVALRALTPRCLELLEGRESAAVVEAQGASRAFAEIVMASIEPEWAQAVAAALGPEARAAGVVRLPARLRVSPRAARGWPCRAGSDAPARPREGTR